MGRCSSLRVKNWKRIGCSFVIPSIPAFVWIPDQNLWVLDSQCSAKLQFSKSLAFSETLEKAPDF